MKRSATLRLARGLSLVEMLVGITIGLFVLAGATLMATTQLSDNRRLTLETQLNQDVRATLDVMSRELRQIGFWERAWITVRRPQPPDAPGWKNPNPYKAIGPKDLDQTHEFLYARSTDPLATRVLAADAPPQGVAQADDHGGFRISGGVLQMMLGGDADGVGNWQPLTDPAVMRVLDFRIVRDLDSQFLVMCGSTCEVSTGHGPLKFQRRRLVITLTAQSAHDPRVVRSMTIAVRPRNDLVDDSFLN